MGGSCPTVVLELAARSLSVSVLASYHNVFVSSNVECRHESRRLELRMEVTCKVINALQHWKLGNWFVGK